MDKTYVDKFVVDGAALSFVRAGSGSTQALLLHGFGSDRTSWLFNQTAATSRATIFALDLPAHGASDAEAGDGSLQFLTERVAAFITARMDTPAHFVAHSLGGAIAINLAHRRPELVGSLFLIAPAGLGRGVDPGFLDEFPEIENLDQALLVLQRLVSRPRMISKEMAARVLGHLRRPRVRDALRRIAVHLKTINGALFPAIANLSKAPRRIQVVWGSEDTINPLGGAHGVGSELSFEIVGGTGHLPHMEKAETVNGLLDRFLADVGTAGGPI